MARDSEDKDTRDSSSKPDNPFIKFRQFADEQISSLLQGIIGLPTAFSKTSGNARWADFDEDLRRRDELKARQKELRDSEARKTVEGVHNEENDISIKRYPGWNAPLTSTAQTSESTNASDDAYTKDLPLYSPVSRSLFAHLDGSGGEETSWDPLQRSGFSNGFVGVAGFDTSNHSSHMGFLQRLFLSDLQFRPQFRSDYSLLPYLLFSPYSPIRLDTDTNHTGLDDTSLGRAGPLYCAAFEDLILATQGQPMTGLGSTLSSVFLGPSDPFFGYNYISNMRAKGMLHFGGQRTEEIVAKPISILDKVSFSGQAKARGNVDAEHTSKHKHGSKAPGSGSGLDVSTDSKSPDTEEEMYGRFLKYLSPNAPNKELEQLLERLDKEFQTLTPGAMMNMLTEFMPLIKGFIPRTPEEEQNLQSMVEDISRNLMSPPPQDTQEREQSEGKPQSSIIPTFTSSSSSTSSTLASASTTSPPSGGSERVVSSSTTSEHTTHDDGSVETSVTVWKRFADGRETVTTTSHIEDPARDDEQPRGANTPSPTSTPQADDDQKEKKKKGWFWN